MRPAQSGDVCILLEPSAGELSRLRAFQLGLQAAFGGQLVGHVHVTCQRFQPDGAEHLLPIIDRVIVELSRLEPFPLLPGSVVTLHSDYWQTDLARWTVQETPAWRTLIATLNQALREQSCPPHYAGDRPPTCGALEHIPPLTAPVVDMSAALPPQLFEARRVVFSQVGGRGLFTLLKTAELGRAGEVDDG